MFLLEITENMQGYEEVKKSFLEMPFALGLSKKTLNVEKLSLDEIITAIHTANFLNFPSRDLPTNFCG